MAFQPGLRTINFLAANQAVASSVTPVDITGFTKAILAGQRLAWQLDCLFSLGATGGFRFLAHNTSAPTTYNAAFEVRDLTTPATITAGQTTEAAFANASAVASNYILRATGIVIANAATTFSFQFAQNTSDVLPITILAGARFQLVQF